jgi:hypothetical protein
MQWLRCSKLTGSEGPAPIRPRGHHLTCFDARGATDVACAPDISPNTQSRAVKGRTRRLSYPRCGTEEAHCPWQSHPSHPHTARAETSCASPVGKQTAGSPSQCHPAEYKTQCSYDKANLRTLASPAKIRSVSATISHSLLNS